MTRAAVVAVAAVVVLLAGGCGRTDPARRAASERAQQVRRLAGHAGLSSDVGRFLATAAGVVGRRFRITYALGGEAGGTTQVFQDPPRRRVDVDSDEPDAAAIRDLTTGHRSFHCTGGNDGWTCRRAGAPELPGTFATGDVTALVNALRTARHDYTFRIIRRRLLGSDATCLVTELVPGRSTQNGLGQKGTLCNSAEGVPLLVETPARSVRALRYSTKVPNDAFDVPG